MVAARATDEAQILYNIFEISERSSLTNVLKFEVISYWNLMIINSDEKRKGIRNYLLKFVMLQKRM